MNPYESNCWKEKAAWEKGFYDKKQELDNAHFFRIMWKGLFIVSAALNVAWWMVTVL